jgi:uncharacterized protein YjdB
MTSSKLSQMLILSFALAPLLVACGDTATKVEVSPERALLTSAGQSLSLTATAKSKKGALLADAKLIFKSSAPGVATVDSKGGVRALKSGSATITVTAGKVSGTMTVSVQIPKRIEISPNNPVYNLGISTGFRATVYTDADEKMIAGKTRWTSSDATIVSIDDAGNLKTLKEGKVTLTVFAAGIKGTTVVTVSHERLDKDGYLTQEPVKKK